MAESPQTNQGPRTKRLSVRLSSLCIGLVVCGDYVLASAVPSVVAEDFLATASFSGFLLLRPHEYLGR